MLLKKNAEDIGGGGNKKNEYTLKEEFITQGILNHKKNKITNKFCTHQFRYVKPGISFST